MLTMSGKCEYMTKASTDDKPKGSNENDESLTPKEGPNHESIKPEHEKGDGAPS